MNINIVKIATILPLLGTLGFPALSGATGKGEISRPNELQQKPKVANNNRLPAMAKPAALMLPDKKTLKRINKTRLMPTVTNHKLNVLKNSPGTNRLQSMPAATGVNSVTHKGTGLQQGRKPVRIVRLANNRLTTARNNQQENNSYLHVVMEVSKNGTVKVLSAVKVNGTVVNTKEALGDFIYNIKLANKSVLVQAIPDPFEMRSFPGPEGSGLAGHHFEQAKTARLIIKIPSGKAAIKQLSTIKMNMYQLTPGYQIRKIDSKIFNKLKLDKRLKTIVSLPSLKLAPLIKQKLILPPR